MSSTSSAINIRASTSGTNGGSSGHGNLILRKQLMELRKRPVDGFSAGLVDDDNLLEWDIMIIGPADTLYEGAFLKARLTFPEEYPLLPPKMKFITKMWHPNSKPGRCTETFSAYPGYIGLVYPDGTVCISILHAPGDDVYGYEDAGERWLPVHTVETVLISVISLLSQSKPDLDSPANVDAAKEVRDDFASYKKTVRRLVRVSADEAFD